MGAEVLGAGDVVGIDPRMITRIDPAPGSTGFEPNYMPFVEFADADFLWRYSFDAGSGARVTPWLPWMLMGTKPGHCLYNTDFAGGPNWDVVPERSKDVLAYVEKHYPQYLTAPDKDYGPSLSSLENYAKTQKPAPVK